MQHLLWKKGIVTGILLLFFAMTFIPVSNASEVWGVTISCSNITGQFDSVLIGEATDANDGPPADGYDMAKPPAPMTPYIRTWLNDDLPDPYDLLSDDYRSYPDSYKVWNLTIQWMPDGESIPSTITIAWNYGEFSESEYTSVNLCDETGVPLQDMLTGSSYDFSCPPYIPQNFKVICLADVNLPPVANSDTYTLNEDSTLTIGAPGVLGNDNDPDGDPMTSVKQTEPSHGIVTLNSNGGFTYTPEADYSGSDSFTYKAYDADLYSDLATVTVTIDSINDAPVVTDIPGQMIPEGSTFSTIPLDTYVSDVDNTDAQMTWTYSGSSQLTVSIVNRVATITIPNEDWNGAETITFRATDPEGSWDSDSATFTVTAVNTPPIVGDIPGQTILEGSTFSTIALDAFVTDADDADAQITWTFSGNTQLSVTIVNRVATITTPNANWYGSETIIFRATDPGLLWDEDPATFTVTGVNDAPVVSDIPSQTILEGSTFSTITLDNYVSDVDNTDAQMTWTYSGNSQLAVSIVNRIATITMPSIDWYGSETITFRATDPGGLWDNDPASFTVTNLNAAPVVTNIPDQTIAEGSSFTTITLDNYVSDPDNADAQMTWTYSGSSQLTISLVNRIATITLPNSNWNGAETILFRATDPGGLWDDDPATFTVTAVNDAPVVGDIPGQTILQGSTFSTISLDTYVSDVDNTDTQMTWTYSGNDQVTVNILNRIVTLTIPNGAWDGSETIIFRATDPNGLWDEDSAIFTVTSMDSPPNPPNTPSPANSATGVSITADIAWSGGDPDAGDSVFYDVYFGTSNSPLIVSHNQSGSSYDPGTLPYNTMYYWRVVSWDSHTMSASSPLWHFVTVAQSSGSDGGGGGGGDVIEEPPQTPSNIAPVANVSAGEPYQGFVDSVILFDGSLSVDSDGNITTWSWVFGDNSTGTGQTVTHTYSQKGTYTVTLTITDDDGATNTDSTTCIILQPNLPPSQPRITGPANGTKNTLYTYTAMSTDADNDSIQYTFDWEDSLVQLSPFVPSGTSYSMDHTWTAAGRYIFTVTATDNQTTASTEFMVYIDAVPVEAIGYLLDNDSDGIYDAFFSSALQKTEAIQWETDKYIIDSDGDGKWDAVYSTTLGITPYVEQPIQTYGLEVIIAVIAIAVYLFWRVRRKNEKE